MPVLDPDQLQALFVREGEIAGSGWPLGEEQTPRSVRERGAFILAEVQRNGTPLSRTDRDELLKLFFAASRRARGRASAGESANRAPTDRTGGVIGATASPPGAQHYADGMPLIPDQDIVVATAVGGGPQQAAEALKTKLKDYPPVRIVSIAVTHTPNPLGAGSLGATITAVVDRA